MQWGGGAKEHRGNRHLNPKTVFNETETTSGHDFK